LPADDITDVWRTRAAQWLEFARAPGHDVFFDELNLPWFAELLPAAGRRTLDVGCGEGRLGRLLVARGHTVCGIDSSPLLVEAAGEAGGYEELVCGDAGGGSLPWHDGSFDLAVSHMVLQDMTDPAACIAEVARVLGSDGHFCLAVPNPVNAPAASRSRYFDQTPGSESVTRAGRTMDFVWIDRPLSFYTETLARCGFVIERLREPRPSPEAVRRHPALASARDAPFFLHLRCRRAG
jgi:SAM-dependent methyltransferase